MGNVIACYKWVQDEEDIRVADDLSVDFSKCVRKIGDYDRNAIQAAVEAAAALEGKAVGLSVGDSSATKSVKDALSRGLDELIWVNTGESAPQDARIVANTLAAAAKRVDDISLIVCSEGSSDQFNRQGAIRLAGKLGLPVVTSVSEIQIEGSVLKATRQLEDEIEHIEVKLPAVVAVLPEVADAPIPSLKQIMAAGKKPATELSVSDLGISFDASLSLDEVKGYASNRKNILFDSADENYISELVSALHKEGVI